MSRVIVHIDSIGKRSCLLQNPLITGEYGLPCRTRLAGLLGVKIGSLYERSEPVVIKACALRLTG